jgi:hypothetical protein
MFIRAPRDGVTDTPSPQVLPKAMTTVPFVPYKSVGTESRATWPSASHRPLFNQLSDQPLLMPMARRQDESHQFAVALGPNMNLGAQSSPTSTNSFSFGVAFFAPAACWWARTVVPSTKCTVQSMPSSAWLMAWTWARIPSQTPALRHRWNRLYTVGQGPYRSGRSRHGAPVRSTHRMPSITGRSSLRGRPSFARSGSSGCSFSHCSFVRSPRFIPTRLASSDQFAYTP